MVTRVTITTFILFAASSCGFLMPEEETISTTYEEKFKISITCDSGFFSSSQYLRVAVGPSEIFKSFTRSFDTFSDCSRSVEKLTVVDGSAIELFYYDGPRRYSVDVMKEF